MNHTRINQLKIFLKETPNDPFLHYALALEYLTQDTPDAIRKTTKEFHYLLTIHPTYLPAYYHAGAHFSRLGKSTMSRKIYNDGISLARKEGSTTALRELQNALQLLDEEIDL